MDPQDIQQAAARKLAGGWRAEQSPDRRLVMYVNPETGERLSQTEYADKYAAMSRFGTDPALDDIFNAIGGKGAFAWNDPAPLSHGTQAEQQPQVLMGTPTGPAGGKPRSVAALYVDVKRGPYAKMEGVSPWGEAEDATKYQGPDPVVAHPPCGHWGRYACKAHDTGETGPIAVQQVQKFGGVLEQPAHSKLFDHMQLPRPGELPDAHGGYTIEVAQRDFGHRADKPTWLYVVGTPPGELPPMPPPQPPRQAITPKVRQLVEGADPGRRAQGTRGIVETMSKNQRHLTPEPFADWLVEAARRAKR